MNVFVRFGPEISCLNTSETSEIADFVSEKYNIEKDLFWISGNGVTYDVNLRMLGGKGGFGRAMKQEGERLSKRLPHHKDFCRTITGKKIGVLKAKKKVRELQAKIKELEEQRAEKKRQMKSSQAAKDLEKLESQEHELTSVMQDAVAKGLEVIKVEETNNRQPCVDDDDFAMLYEN